MAAYIYALINQKGGVGKTTASIQLGVGLKKRGYRVLILDMDPQCNLSFSLKADYINSPTILDAIYHNRKLSEVIQHLDEIDVVAGDTNLSLLEQELHSDPDKQDYLCNILPDVLDLYDFIIIDSPPSLSLITVGIISAANSLIIPSVLELYSLQGTGQIYQTFVAIREYRNPKLVIDGVLITKNKEFLKKELMKIASMMHTKVFDSAISDTPIASHASLNKKSIFAYAPQSKMALEYDAVIDELLENKKRRDENESR